MGSILYTIRTEKDYRTEIEKDVLFEKDIKEILKEVEDTATIEEVQEFYNIKEKEFPPVELPRELWEYRKMETTPRIWRAIYKYGDDYGESDWWGGANPYDTSLFEKSRGKKIMIDYFSGKRCDRFPANYKAKSKKGDTILDFGAGGSAGFEIDPTKKYYLVEINNYTFNRLKEYYKGIENVFIYQNLSDVADMKFDLVWSHDVLEHVRLFNEHLNILYRLCNDDGILDIHASTLGVCDGGHIYGTFKDSTIRFPYNLIFDKTEIS